LALVRNLKVLLRGNEIRTDLVVCTVRMYVNLMFVGFDRSRWIQELDELDRIINENPEQILESVSAAR
jgi:hypothetical protein